MMIGLLERCLWSAEEYHQMAEGDGYKEMFRVSRNSQISAVAFPEVTFQVEDLIR
jgi:hypothetical protein